MRKLMYLLSLLLVMLIWTTAAAETDFMEAAAPNGWVFQNFQIYQHGEDFANDDIPLSDMDLDVYLSMFRVAKWWDTGVAHAIIPVGYIDQTAYASPAGEQIVYSEGIEAGLADSYLGYAYRWSNKKDWWFLAGMDLRLPTGEYNSKDDPYCTGHFQTTGGCNLGNGSFSLQPFLILSKLYEGGMLGTDTEVRMDINTSAGPIQYDPDDRLEVWQTLHMGVIPGKLRVGATLKAEVEIEDDDMDNDHSTFVGVGPEIMYVMGDVILWGKVTFDVYTNDYPEKLTTAYLRLSVPF